MSGAVCDEGEHESERERGGHGNRCWNMRRAATLSESSMRIFSRSLMCKC